MHNFNLKRGRLEMNAQQRAYFSDCLCNNNLNSRITKNIYNEELKKSY